VHAEDDLRALVERAQSADPDAWEGLYRHAHPRLWAFARRRLATNDQAEDAVSEAMARAIASIDRFTWTGAGFDGWLFGILRNVVHEAYRGTARNDRQLGLVSDLARARGAAPDPLDHLVADEESATLRAAFDRLEPDERELLELRVVGRLDAEAVGVIIGKRAGAVRMAQSRALDRLRALLGEEVR
jgi:RNA polymerase sigma-70 factor (ECF subfamily)